MKNDSSGVHAILALGDVEIVTKGVLEVEVSLNRFSPDVPRVDLGKRARGKASIYQ